MNSFIHQVDILRKKYQDKLHRYANIANELCYIANPNYEKQYINKTILAYTFFNIFSIDIALNLDITNDKLLIVSRNNISLDALLYYFTFKKYVKYNIDMLLTNTSQSESIIHQLQKVNIISNISSNYDTMFIDDIVNNDYIEHLNKNGSLYLFIDASDKAQNIIDNISQKFEETLVLENYTHSLKVPRLIVLFKNFGKSGTLVNVSKHIKKLYEIQSDYLLQVQNVADNHDKPNFIENKMRENLQYSLAFAKTHKLNIIEWFDKESTNKYFNNVISKEYNNSTRHFAYVLPANTIGKLEMHNNITIPCRDDFENVFHLSEDVYQYIDKLDNRRFKGTELFFNKIYKLVNKYLFDQYKVNINDKYVSRAWIKMYELLSETGILDKYSDELKVFHICEAPGNFINSMIYFIKSNKPNIKKYTWNAQSLHDIDTEIFDEYGFIKQTQDKWDFGKTGTGDIMNPNNFKYYIEKYTGVDLLIGDCGVAFELGKPDDLAAYQLLYALILPKKNGSAVIKTFAVEYNDWYISLLYTCTQYYEQVMIFKSSINFWSPEIYIVLKGFKGMLKNDRDILIEIGLNKKYPTSYIPAEFCTAYKYFTNEIVVSYVNMKKLFVFLTKNPDVFEKNKAKFAEMVHKQNIKWLEKYMNHLPDVIENYKKLKY